MRCSEDRIDRIAVVGSGETRVIGTRFPWTVLPNAVFQSLSVTWPRDALACGRVCVLGQPDQGLGQRGGHAPSYSLRTKPVTPAIPSVINNQPIPI